MNTLTYTSKTHCIIYTLVEMLFKVIAGYHVFFFSLLKKLQKSIFALQGTILVPFGELFLKEPFF